MKRMDNAAEHLNDNLLQMMNKKKENRLARREELMRLQVYGIEASSSSARMDVEKVGLCLTVSFVTLHLFCSITSRVPCSLFPVSCPLSLVPLYSVPCTLSLVPCPLFPVSCPLSSFFFPCPPFPVSCSLSPVPRYFYMCFLSLRIANAEGFLFRYKI